MSSRTKTLNLLIFFRAIILLLIFTGATRAQTSDAPDSAKKLTVERIYSDPSLSGHALRGIAWTPDGKQVSFLEAKGPGAEDAAEGAVENGPQTRKKIENNAALWVVDAT